LNSLELHCFKIQGLGFVLQTFVKPCTFRTCNIFVCKCPLFILIHTFLVLVTVGIGHGVYRKLYTLIGGQCSEKFENHWLKRTTMQKKNNANFSKLATALHQSS